MNQIFNYDNKFFRGVSKIIDCVWLSLLWFMCCIPVFTIGAATTALYYTINKSVKNDRGYASIEFFSSFKENFKQSTIVWLIFLGMYTLLGVDYFVMKAYAEAGAQIGKLYVAFLGFGVVVTMWGFYVFPYIARFENTTKNVLKNTLFIAISNIHWTLGITVLFIAMWVEIYLIMPIALIMPVLYQFLKSIAIERVFKKYMTPEDLELEEERNITFHN